MVEMIEMLEKNSSMLVPRLLYASRVVGAYKTLTNIQKQIFRLKSPQCYWLFYLSRGLLQFSFSSLFCIDTFTQPEDTTLDPTSN